MIAANDEVVASAPANDFEDNGVRLPVEYRYDGSGNLTADANKGLDSIAYNYLNLPEFLHWTNGNTLRYVYSATGRKLLAYADGHDQPDGPPVHRLTAYVGPSGFQYATDASDSLRLLHVPTPEGRLVFLPDRADKNAGFGWQYEYHLKDQVGNLRLAFRTRGRTARDIEDSFEPDQGRSANQQPQVEHENETRYRAPLLARTGEHVALVNARDQQHRVGPSLTVPVQAGDSVYASVYARVEPPLPRPWWKMAVLSPEIAELDGAKNSRRVRFWPRLGLNLAPWLLPQTHRTTTTGQVYMRVQTLNEQQQVLSEERFYVDPTVSPTQWQYLLAKLAAAQSGYVRVELVNESGDNAYFDDLQVRLVNDLIQENHYDPFGLNLAELEVKGDPDCKYQFNGKEKQEDFGLGWNFHDVRTYDPQICKFLQIDPLADLPFQDDLSPYHFGFNNPVLFSDPSGLCPTCPKDASEGDTYVWAGNTFTFDGTNWTFTLSGEVEAIGSKEEKAEESTDESDNSVGAPSTLESMIPIWGSGREAINDFQQGRWAWGTFNTAMAISDVFLVKSIGTALMKGAVKSSGSFTWGAVRKWYGKRYATLPGQHVHHWAVPRNGWGKNVPNWFKNQPWNLRPLPPSLQARGYTWDQIHRAIEGKRSILELNFVERIWYGTPGWPWSLGASYGGRGVEAMSKDSEEE